MRQSIPDDEFLFFLDGPWSITGDDPPPDPDEELAYALPWYYPSIVQFTEEGLRFVHANPEFDFLLETFSTFASIEESIARK